MTRGLVLIGASGLAREVLAAGATGVVGVADDDPARHGRGLAGHPVIGSIADMVHRDDDLLVCLGPGHVRRSVVRRLVGWGVPSHRFATFIARSARVGRSSTVGHGSILLDGVVVTADAAIGSHVVVMPNCTVTHDGVIEDFATLAAGVALGGSVRIREAAYIGMNAAIRQHVDVGANATVGMSAVVLADVPPGEVWAGVPARLLERVAVR